MAALLVLARPAAADPRLTLTHAPPPRTLHMRARVVARAPPARRPRAATGPMPAAPPPLASAPPLRPRRARGDRGDRDDIGGLRDLGDPVSFSLDLGYQVEAANPSGRARLGARAPVDGQDYARLRAYGFGEAIGSTRGLGLAGLSSYVQLRFQAARRLRYQPEAGPQVEVAPPIATWFERSGVEIRTGWAEVRDLLPARWRLSQLRLRAGSQHVYGPWITHLDGALVAYDGALVTASAYAGLRHADYTRELVDTRPTVSGAALRFDLRGLPRPLPIAVAGELLRIGPARPSTAAAQPATASALLQADWRPRRDIAVIGQVRTLDGEVASQRLEVRARYQQVTNVLLALVRRTADDWQWDPALSVPDPDPMAARRYLDLGPVVPQLTGSVRAGTLIAENIDLLVRGAFAADGTDATGAIVNSFAAPYVELGGAVELRLRRTLALTLSALHRNTDRAPALPQRDVSGEPGALPAQAARGEEAFTEIGAAARLSLGARRFSSLVELFGRRTGYAALYEDPLLAVATTDVRLGTRITLEAWVGPRLRLFAAYDLSSALDAAPEISGYRSLRLMMSGVY